MRSPMRAFLAVFSLCLAWLAAGCEKADPLFCCTTREACLRPGGTDGELVECPPGQFCDNEGALGGSRRTCQPDPGGTCREPQDCTDPSRPFCIGGLCRECDRTDACPKAEPVCETATAFECRGCGGEGDCSRFADAKHCDTGTGACVECRAPGCTKSGVRILPISGYMAGWSPSSR